MKIAEFETWGGAAHDDNIEMDVIRYRVHMRILIECVRLCRQPLHELFFGMEIFIQQFGCFRSYQ